MHSLVFIDTAGHSAGLILFGLLAVLFWQNKPAEQNHQTRLHVSAALLVFVWNLAQLLLLAPPTLSETTLNVVEGVSILCLTFLPAILLHISLNERLQGIAFAGYALSVSSLFFQYASGSLDSYERSRTALLVLALGFAFLSLLTWLWSEYDTRHKPDLSRPSRIAFVSLFVFATSFIHFQPGHSSNLRLGEALWHHAAIPIALIILLQSYRFLLLDTFLRFTVSTLWVAFWIWAFGETEAQLHLWKEAAASEFARGLLITALCILIYVLARSLRPLQSLLTRFAFRRPPLNPLLDLLRQLKGSSELHLLETGAEQIRQHYGCRHAAVIPAELSSGQAHPLLVSAYRGKDHTTPDWTAVLLPLRCSTGNSCQICLSSRKGGRRFLSEDLLELQKVQALLVERIERLRREQLESLAQEAEFRALQAQVNPHFLFNALNTLYGTIRRDDGEARQLVLNLADVFRYRLKSNRRYVTLSEEIEIVRAYLAIETLRLGARLITEIKVDEQAKDTQIPILTVQPLVENSIKHGASSNGQIFVSVIVVASASGTRISVEDRGPGFQTGKPSNGAGVGLKNVHQRLHLCYGAGSCLEFHSDSTGSKVWFTVPDNPAS